MMLNWTSSNYPREEARQVLREGFRSSRNWGVRVANLIILLGRDQREDSRKDEGSERRG